MPAPPPDGLTPLLAAPIAEWAREDDPRLALWHACDAVEMTLRLSVALGLGDWARAGAVPPALRGEVARRLEQPTLGRWRGMALAIARVPAPKTALADLWRWILETLEPMLAGADPASSLTELRNRLAHGGGVSHGLAAELVHGWTPRLDAAFGGLATLADVRLVAPGAGIVLGDDDADARARAIAWAEGRALPAEAVVAVRGAHVLPLWPLVAYASPSGEPRAVLQVYVRRGEVRLVMTPLGAERAAVAESSEAAVGALVGAGLFGEPAPPPVVALEIAGFEAELRRDAGSCVGRDAEVRAIADALRGAPALVSLWGPPGSGKSLALARALSGAPDVIAFRFRAGDARCTRDAFLRFVVERAGTPPRGKPLLAAAKELLAARPLALAVDGVDDIVAIEPGFVAEVLVPLAKAARVIVASRTRLTGASELFAGGLPAMAAADVRAMLLDKIGPLSKRLVALDRDRAEEVVNPFVDAVVARAAGLPVYVAYVIGDVLAGRLATLDASALPPSLAAYHAAVLRRGGAGAAQQLVTPLVATLAIAREPLTAPALHALLVDRVLATDDVPGASALADALAQVATLLHRDDDDRYALFHATLRDHVRSSAEQAMAVTTARIAMGRAARAIRTGPAARYLDDHGVAHLLEAGDVDGAVAALAWPRLIARIERGALTAVLADLARVAPRVPAIADLYAFVRGAAHHVERGGVIALWQVALVDGDGSAIREAALVSPPAAAIRRLDRLPLPPGPRRSVRQRTLVGHAAPVRALVRADGLLVSASGDGTLRVWDAGDGSHLRTLAPALASMSATTRAVPAGAPRELAGAMPVLGAHALCVAAGAIVAAHGDGWVRRWPLDGERALAEQRLGTYVWGVAALDDDRVALAGDDGVLRIVDARTLALIGESRPSAATGDGAPYLYACATVAGALVIAGASRGLGVLDARTLAPLGELRGHEGAPRALAPVPGTTHLLSTGRDGAVALWDVAARRLLARVAVAGEAWSVAATRAHALVGTRDGQLVRLRLPDLAVDRALPVHAGAVTAVVALDDGRAVTGGDDRALRLVDLDAAASARPSHAGAITAIAIDGAQIVTGGADGTIKHWDAARGRSLRTVAAHPGGVTALAAAGGTVFSAAGTTVLAHRGGTSQALPAPPAAVHALVARSADELCAACADGGVRVWTRAGGWAGPVVRHDGAALALAVAGATLVSGGADSLVRCSGQIWRGHSWDVVALAAGSDTVVSAGKDGAALVWDARTGTPRATVACHGRALAVAPDGARLAVASREDCVRIVRPDGTELARWTCDAAPATLAFLDARTLAVGDAAGELAWLDVGT